MKVVIVKFTDWDKSYYFTSNNLDLSRGDYVVVGTELGEEIGKVVGFRDVTEKELIIELKKESEDEEKEININIKPVLRHVTENDLKKIPDYRMIKDALAYAKEMKDKHVLEMKFVDVHFSYDGSRITFAFIADGRVDFRMLVKDLTRHFGKTIRLQQIGIRDEAKICGDCGHCGRPLCCRGHLKNLTSITSEMTDLQQCAHRGSDRVSGVCGRLMCCLAYEQVGYEELKKKMPPIGTRVSVDGKRGEVVAHHVLKQSVMVKFPGENDNDYVITEVDLNRNKK